MLDGPEAQDNLFRDDPRNHKLENIPQSLVRATLRLEFPPTYVVIGHCIPLPGTSADMQLEEEQSLVQSGYVRLFDYCKNQIPIMPFHCQAVLTFGVQRKFIQIFLAK
ncbi:hypothetical protein C0989_001251 [Termitomyces sp. Mn162]|nr:hypothetical protein C0989_001251 [Termitomyces sp. Mn162]